MDDLIKEDVIKINNNPLMFSGRIGRKAYFLTIFIAYLLAGITNYITKTLYSGSLVIIFFILGLIVLIPIPIFAVIKRLRDINLNVWFVLLFFIPYVGIIGQILLLFIKSSYDGDGKEI